MFIKHRKQKMKEKMDWADWVWQMGNLYILGNWAQQAGNRLCRRQPKTTPEGAGPCARARSLRSRAPQAPQPSAELPIRHSRSPRSDRSWLHPPLCKCAAAHAGWQGGGAGGREGGRPPLAASARMEAGASGWLEAVAGAGAGISLGIPDL